MSELTHFDTTGQAHMVDIHDKDNTRRIAIAEGWIHMLPATLALIRSGNHRKGDVLGIARIAAIQAAKRTSDLIPLCHPIALTHVRVGLECHDARPSTPPPGGPAVRCAARLECTGRTGVEMEALTAVQIGLLTIYDMCKAVDRGMVMGSIRLLEKHGGKSGSYISG